MISTDNILSKFKKYELLIVSIFVILVSFILTGNFILPNFNRIDAYKKEISDLTNKIQVLKSKDTALNSIDEDYYRSNFVKLNIILPEGKDYVSLFNTFDTLEGKTGISITKTNFQLGVVSTNSAKLVKTPGSIAFEIPMSFSVKGNLNSIVKFLSALKDLSGRLITVDKIDWSSEKGNTEMTFQGKAYFYPYPFSIGNVNSPLSKISENQEELLSKISKTKFSIQPAEKIDNVPVGKKDLFQ